MRAAALALCLLLAGCVETTESVRLVCMIDGREVYRSPPATWWKFSNGLWWTRNQAHQYRQSALESCRTEAL